MEIAAAAAAPVSRSFATGGAGLNHLQPQRRFKISVRAVKDESRNNASPNATQGKRKWRRRRLLKEDIEWQAYQEEPDVIGDQDFLVRVQGKQEIADAGILLNRAENRFAFVRKIAEEAAEMMNKDPDAFLHVHPALKILTDYMKEAGYDRPDGYKEDLFGCDDIIV